MQITLHLPLDLKQVHQLIFNFSHGDKSNQYIHCVWYFMLTAHRTLNRLILDQMTASVHHDIPIKHLTIFK
jgi:hypothetical protein